MTDLHALQDVDPLNPSDVDRIYAEGFADGWTSTKPRSLSAPLVLGLIAGAFLAGFIVHAALAAPRAAPEITSPAVSPAGPQTQLGAPRVSLNADRGRSAASSEAAGTRALRASGAPTPSPAALLKSPATPRPKPPSVTAGTVRGTATWYDDHRKSGLYAAVHSWRWGDTPYRVVVRAGDRSVVVTVSDYCLCTGGGDRVIDLSNEAFARLAPLSAGVVGVTVRGLR